MAATGHKAGHKAGHGMITASMPLMPSKTGQSTPFAGRCWLGPTFDATGQSFAGVAVVQPTLIYLLRCLPRIDEGHTHGLKIGDVARDYCHAMHKGGCRDKCIALATPVRYMQFGTALCHSGIDR